MCLLRESLSLLVLCKSLWCANPVLTAVETANIPGWL